MQYSHTQIEELCTKLYTLEVKGEGTIDIYEHPYGGDEETVIAVTSIKGERVAFMTSFYDPNDDDFEMIIGEGVEAIELEVSDIRKEEGDYIL